MTRRRLIPRAPVVIALLTCALLAASCSDPEKEKTAADDPTTIIEHLPLIVVSGPTSARWTTMLRSSGLSVREGTLDELIARRAGVVPNEVSLSVAQVQRVAAWVDRGGILVSDEQPILEALGTVYVSAITPTTVQSLNQEQDATWPKDTATATIGPSASTVDPISLVWSGESTIAMTFSHGAGKVLALGVTPFAKDRIGHELLPELGRHVLKLTGARGPRRDGLELYLDPGTLNDGVKGKLTLDQMVDLAAEARVVHVAGWNFGFTNPADDFDYAQLIEKLHARGILAFAWLEPPLVNLKMWEDWPQCRERTADGREAIVDWRNLIALEDPGCFDAAWSYWRPFLSKFNWDGVNVAELYFEPDNDPRNQTPFHPTALARFGSDPKADPEKFLDWRTTVVTQLNADMLAQLNGLPRASQMDFMLTVIDDDLDPELARKVGSRIADLAKVARTAGATLQVEDPFTQWAKGPLRYDSAQKSLDAAAGKAPAFFDINVVNRSGLSDTVPVTPKMTGVELGLAAMSAGRSQGRVAFYAIGTIAPQDVEMIPASLAGSVAITDSGVNAPFSVFVPAPTDSARSAIVDGNPWPFGAGGVIVPKGEHQIQWSGTPSSVPGLLRFSAELGTATANESMLELRYDSRLRAFGITDRKPISISIDGVKVSDAEFADAVTGAAGGDNRFLVKVPAGSHTVTLAL